MRTLVSIVVGLQLAAAGLPAEEPPAISQIIPTVVQVGHGCTSNRVVVLVDPLSSPSEMADLNEGPGWLELAKDAMRRTPLEARALLRYYFGRTNCMIWISRWKTDADLREVWKRGQVTNAPAGGLPKVGEEVRFYQRDGMYNNIAFRRGRYSIDVETPIAYGVGEIIRLAEVLDKNLLRPSPKPAAKARE